MSAPGGPRVVLFHRLATSDYRVALRRYGRRKPAAAQRFRAQVSAVAQRIAVAAEQGVPYRAFYRWMRVRRFPYLLYYEILDPTQVIVYAVAHTSRRPGYWVRRRSHP